MVLATILSIYRASLEKWPPSEAPLYSKEMYVDVCLRRD